MEPCPSAEIRSGVPIGTQQMLNRHLKAYWNGGQPRARGLVARAQITAIRHAEAGEKRCGVRPLFEQAAASETRGEQNVTSV